MPSLKSWFSSGSIYFEIKLFICGINNSMHLKLLQVIHLSQNVSSIYHSFVFSFFLLLISSFFQIDIDFLLHERLFLLGCKIFKK